MGGSGIQSVLSSSRGTMEGGEVVNQKYVYTCLFAPKVTGGALSDAQLLHVAFCCFLHWCKMTLIVVPSAVYRFYSLNTIFERGGNKWIYLPIYHCHRMAMTPSPSLRARVVSGPLPWMRRDEWQ